jgi:hypothetical protein
MNLQHQLSVRTQVDITRECCICFDANDDFLILTCCNNNAIHRKCLFITFLNFPYFPFERTMPCPLCRGELYISEYFSLDDII